MATTVQTTDLVDYWQDAATQTLPTYTELTSSGFAQDGDPVTGQRATLPGAAWFNIIAAMRVSLIKAAGLTPATTPDPLQFLTALQSMAWMQNGKISTAMLASNAVETAKIKDAAVTAAKLASNAVETAKIANGAVSFAKIASGDIATQAEAEAGTASNCLMTPQRVAQAIAALAQQTPTGMLACFACTAIPEGWLACNGAKVSRTTYAALFAAIGTTFGAGDGSTTFTLPNLDGRFLEGTTNISQVGKMIEAGLPNITGDYQALSAVNWQQADGAFFIDGAHGAIAQGIESQTSSSHMNFDASRLGSGFGKSSTVQPSSVRALICIRT